MKKTYLDFEKSIESLETKIESLKKAHEEHPSLNIEEDLKQLERKADKSLHEIYDNLSAWQISQVARHPQRPYTLDYINYIFSDFHELHGDRAYADDPAIVGGLAQFEGQVSPDDFTGGNRVSANKLYDLQTIQNLKAMMLIINIRNNIQSIDIKNILKPYTDLNINQNVKKCKVKIEYENDQGKAEILLGRDWEVMLHEDLITHLYQTFDNENVKILYN